MGSVRKQPAADYRVVRTVDLVRVHPRALKDPVLLSAVTADDFEVTLGIECVSCLADSHSLSSF